MMKMLKRAQEDSWDGYQAFLDLQRYKIRFLFGVRAAILWLRIWYGWNDSTGSFIKRRK